MAWWITVSFTVEWWIFRAPLPPARPHSRSIRTQKSSALRKRWKHSSQEVTARSVSIHGTVLPLPDGEPEVDMPCQRACLGWARNNAFRRCKCTTMSSNTRLNRGKYNTIKQYHLKTILLHRTVSRRHNQQSIFHNHTIVLDSSKIRRRKKNKKTGGS